MYILNEAHRSVHLTVQRWTLRRRCRRVKPVHTRMMVTHMTSVGHHHGVVRVAWDEHRPLRV